MNFEKIKPKIIQLAKQDETVELLWLYGSYAKGTAHQKSDIDLAVIFKSWEKNIITRRLRSELVALEWQQTLKLKESELSVLDMNISAIPLAMSVLKSGELLLSKNLSRQLQEQQRIMSKWELDYLYHYQNQQFIYG